MSVSTYNQILTLIENREEFDGRSMSAKRYTYPFNTIKKFNLSDVQKKSLLMYQSLSQMRDTDLYVVYSYRTPIAWAVDGLHAHINEDKFSVTTGKHQSYVRRGIDRYISEEEL